MDECSECVCREVARRVQARGREGGGLCVALRAAGAGRLRRAVDRAQQRVNNVVPRVVAGRMFRSEPDPKSEANERTVQYSDGPPGNVR